MHNYHLQNSFLRIQDGKVGLASPAPFLVDMQIIFTNTIVIAQSVAGIRITSIIQVLPRMA